MSVLVLPALGEAIGLLNVCVQGSTVLVNIGLPSSAVQFNIDGDMAER